MKPAPNAGASAPGLRVARSTVAKSGGCNFCTRKHRGDVWLVSSDDPLRHTETRVCPACMEALRAGTAPAVRRKVWPCGCITNGGNTVSYCHACALFSGEGWRAKRARRMRIANVIRQMQRRATIRERAEASLKASAEYRRTLQ